GGSPTSLRPALERGEYDSDQRGCEAELLIAARVVAAGQSPDHRYGCAGPGDRGHDRERARRHPTVERDQPRGPEHRGQAGPENGRAGRSLAPDRDPDAEQRQADRLGDEQDGDWIQRAALDAAEEVADSP